jgi:RsiW-degrading membrane proteinase PrsW (M82 family)
MNNNSDNHIVIKPHRPDFKEKMFFLISGIVVSVPLTLFFGTFAERLCVVLPVFYATICAVVIFTPFIEEFAKAFPLFYRHGETERSIFILGFLVGLGFGISEFFVYVFALEAPVLIRIPGILFHAATASIIAYGIAKKQPIFYYLIAVGLHFLNNFSALFDTGIIGYVIANVAAYYLSYDLYKKTTEKIIDKN